MVLFCISSEIKQDIGRIRDLFDFIPLAFDAPDRGGGFQSEYCHPVWCGRMVGILDGEKN